MSFFAWVRRFFERILARQSPTPKPSIDPGAVKEPPVAIIQRPKVVIPPSAPPPPPVALPMLGGVFNLRSGDIGQGPGGAGSPIWTCGVYIPVMATVVADIAAARAAGVTLFTEFSRARGNWVDVAAPVPPSTVSCQNFNWTKYKAQVDQWTVAGGASAAVANAITLAIADKVMVAYVVDEPFIAPFCGTIPNNVVNDMALHHKLRWPGVITCIRSSSEFMVPPATYLSLVTGTNQTGWTGLDYGWAQWVGQHVPSTGESPAVFFARQKSEMAALGGGGPIQSCGCIPGINLWDGGIYNDSFGIAACWDYDNNGLTSGYVKGSINNAGLPAPAGTKWPCGSRPAVETRVVASPDLLKFVIDACFNDPDFPAFMIWCLPIAGSLSSTALAAFGPMFVRSDFVSKMDAGLLKLATRTASNGWRAAK